MKRFTEDGSDSRRDQYQKGEYGKLAASYKEMSAELDFLRSELKRSKDYLDGILESTSDLIITVSPDDKIISINAGAEEALGYQRQEVIGKPIQMLFVDPRDREKALRKMGPTDNIANYNTRFLTKDGQIKHVLNTISRVRDHSGNILFTIGISKDITEEKRLQIELIQSQRYAAIGQVFTGIQHSMKNMLNACKGGAYMVRLGLKKDDREMFTEGWEIVQEGISRLTDMSMAMLKYVREWKPKFEQVQIGDILSEIDRVIKKTAENKGIEFKLNLPPDLLPLTCDARMVHSVVMDIVSNAMDACTWKEYPKGESAKVEVGAYTSHDNQRMIIEIHDNGCGMTDDVKQNIFTPFFSTKSKSGTGLGLAITSRMIESHNGKIDVDSEPKEGTTFRIVLPRDATT
ncbi:PAS domain S-box protein [bacterium]|nr:PAS domain S-box protein [bacterium]MBU1650832.1 PAS domain S-box protein [bacterium]MBU1882378.1 PAS domain S-box protein [bacterium]